MHSIVRDAPNLEELGLHDMLFDFRIIGTCTAACGRLTVTGFSDRYLPYVSARIERDSASGEAGVRASNGVGTLPSAD